MTNKQGYYGISFPFRVNQLGGISMSKADNYDIKHILESMEQILRTRPKERGMEYHIHSELDLSIFEPNDISTKTLIEYQIEQALSKLEDRIEVLDVEVTQEEEFILANIKFKLVKMSNEFTHSIKVGEVYNVEEAHSRY